MFLLGFFIGIIIGMGLLEIIACIMVSRDERELIEEFKENDLK